MLLVVSVYVWTHSIANHNQSILLYSRIHNHHTSIIVTLRIPTKLCRAKNNSLTSIMVHISSGVGLWGTETQKHRYTDTLEETGVFRSGWVKKDQREMVWYQRLSFVGPTGSWRTAEILLSVSEWGMNSRLCPVVSSNTSKYLYHIVSSKSYLLEDPESVNWKNWTSLMNTVFKRTSATITEDPRDFYLRCSLYEYTLYRRSLREIQE
jgi:hypothetical protein